jgi:hypothetical protein
MVARLGHGCNVESEPLKVAKKSKPSKREDAPDGLWIAPRLSCKGASEERAWGSRPIAPPNSGRYLELADIALGLKIPSSKKAKRAARPRHHEERALFQVGQECV